MGAGVGGGGGGGVYPLIDYIYSIIQCRISYNQNSYMRRPVQKETLI